MRKIDELKEYIGKREKLEQAIALIYWDMRTNMPKNAAESRGKVLEYLSEESFKMITSDKVKEFIDDISKEKGNLTKVELRMLEELEKNYNETKKIPQNRYVEFVGVRSNSEIAWEKAKDAKDFSLFKDDLNKVIEFTKEFVEYWGYEDNKYNTLLDKYEPGLKTEKLDLIFEELKNGIIEILEKIEKSNTKLNRDFLSGNFDVEKQKELSLSILEKMGYNMDSGRLDVSVHPFTINMGNKDVRVTTNYHEEEFTSALFSTIHEGGHGIYEQNISDDLEGTGLQCGASMGIHESQSRLYENILGRSLEFCSYILKEAQNYFEDFKNVSLKDFYEGMNFVERSLIRTEADELTYSLHVIIRYEIEKILINTDVNIDKVRDLWNQKYKEYLGVEPTDDSEGVLQDMHWSDGSFGYFPSYALGNLYGAQIFNKMKEENPDLMNDLKEGNFSYINNWLKEKVHKYGASLTPSELIFNITGEELNPKYFLDYLKNKYYKLYNIQDIN